MARASKSSNYFLPRQQLEELLSRCGINVQADTSTDLICFCPFHQNRDSPAFNISLRGPHLWKCHNGKCAKQGNLVTLLMLKGYSKPEAEKMILHGGVEIDDLVGLVQSLMEDDKDKVNEWVGIDPIRFVRQDEANDWIGRDYFRGRGLTTESCEHFGLGYTKKKDMVVIPIFDEYGKLCGTIGRERVTKQYKYSSGLGRRNTIWNIHNAKRYDSIILVEGALDGIPIHQSGSPNVGAVFGSAISPNQWKLIRKHFTEVVCFFDNDDAGQALTEVVMDNIRDLAVYGVTYPKRFIIMDNGKTRPVKDPGDLFEEEIKCMLENKHSRLDLILKNAI